MRKDHLTNSRSTVAGDSSEDRSPSKTEPVILALETSSKLTSLALARGDTVVSSFSRELDEKRSEGLWLEVERLLSRARIDIHEVDLFAVCTGPGSFTGLRVGMAAAKGFATAVGKPMLAVTALEAVAFSIGSAPAVLAMVNSYKGEVYTQLFSFDSMGVPVAESEPAVTTRYEAVARVAHIDDLIFVGSSAIENLEIIREFGRDRFRERGAVAGWEVKPAPDNLAAHIARLAFLRFSRGEAESAEAIKACYVRPADAEVKLSQGLLGSKIKKNLGRKTV